MLIDTSLLDNLTEQAKNNPRLRMNYNLHDSLESKTQRLLNALEPGTVLPIHRHIETAETYVVIRGKLSVTIYDDNNNIIEKSELNPLAGIFGVQIQKGVWHSVDIEESGTIIFEVKDGPYTPLSQENILK